MVTSNPRVAPKARVKRVSMGSVMAVTNYNRSLFGNSSKGSSKGTPSPPSMGNSPVNRPGFSGCFVCGDMHHDYRNCPRRNQTSGSGQKGGKPIHMVDAVSDNDEIEHSSPILVVEDQDSGAAQAGDDEDNSENISHSIMVAKEAFPSHFSDREKLLYAVVDTGATETVGSLDALEAIMKQRGYRFGWEDVNVDPSVHKLFRFGNAQTRHSESLVYLPQKVHGQSTHVGVFALDVPNIPVLLGIKNSS